MLIKLLGRTLGIVLHKNDIISLLDIFSTTSTMCNKLIYWDFFFYHLRLVDNKSVIFGMYSPSFAKLSGVNCLMNTIALKFSKFQQKNLRKILVVLSRTVPSVLLYNFVIPSRDFTIADFSQGSLAELVEIRICHSNHTRVILEKSTN